MKKLLLILFFLIVPSAAWAQCNGVYAPGAMCGNGSAVNAPPTAVSNAGAIWANAVSGVICDGVTPTTSTFQTAINEAVSTGLPLKFSGDCVITSPGLTINGNLDWSANGPISNILLCDANITCVTVNTTTRVFIHDFQITSLLAGTGTALQVGAPGVENGSSQIYRMVLSGGNPLRMVNAASWVIADNSMTVTNGNGDGIYMADTSNADNGSDTAYGNVISSTVTSGNAVHWQSGGGMRFTNNVIIGTAFNKGIWIDESPGIGTSDIWITNNHIEGSQASGAVCIRLSRTGSASTIGNIIITSNECAGWDVAVYSPTDTTWLSSLTIGDNVIGTSGSASTSQFGYEITTPVSMMTIHHGSVLAVGANNTVMKLGTQTATNCAVGPVPNAAVPGASFVASSVSSCTTYSPF